MFSELASRIKNRPAASGSSANIGGGSVGGGGGGPTQGQLDDFKAALLDGFREELCTTKKAIIDDLIAEVQAMNL